MDEKTIAVLMQGNDVLGYCTEEFFGTAKYRDFKESVKDIPKSLKVIHVDTEINRTDKVTKSIDEILDTMPIGTALRLNGTCEGMGGQQLLYVGKLKDNTVGLEWYWFYDGKYCIEPGMPCAFGYAKKQLNYEGVTADFVSNDENEVNKLRKEHRFLSEVCLYL